MPVGIEIRNNSGFIQIDGAYRNLAFDRKGTMTTDNVAVDTSYGTIALTGLSGFPAVMVQSTAGAYAIVTGFSGSSCNVTIVAKGPVGTSVTYYVFTPPTVTPSYGFEIRNAAGEVVFTAAHKYMKVVGEISGSASTSSADSATVTMPAGRTYAVLASTRPAANRAINQSPSPPFIDYWSYAFIGLYKVNSNIVAITSANNAVAHFGSTRPDEVSFAGKGFIVDVTGY